MTIKMSVGDSHGRLVIKERVPNRNRQITWRCVCACGSQVDVTGFRLRHGLTKSCGCLAREITRLRHRTHGESNGGGVRPVTRTYRAWGAMLDRVNGRGVLNIRNYVNRGITVCESWRKYENFKKDMGEAPLGTSLERLDNNKGYSPENCVWADRVTQARNKRNTFWIEYRGQRKSLAEWCELLKLPSRAIQIRLRSLKWDVAKALETPIRISKRTPTIRRTPDAIKPI